MAHYKTEWKEKATIDYYSHFLALWVGFNSWYLEEYHDYHLTTDRQYINKIKTLFIPTNKPYEQFTSFLPYSRDKKNSTFCAYLEGLYESLERANLKYKNKEGKKLSFHHVLIDRKWVDLLKTSPSEPESTIDLGHIKIGPSMEIFFASIVELIYQVRCLLVHGQMNPKESENYEVIKYCYLILWSIMAD